MIRIIEFPKAKILAIVAAIAMLPLLASAQKMTDVKGHANNEISQPLSGMEVKFSSDNGATFKYTTTTNAAGDYTISLPPGTYIGVVRDPKITDPKKIVDEILNIKIGDAPTTQDFDMTRKEVMDKLTPERRKEIDEFRKKNEEAMKANSQVKNLNAALTQARADIAAKNYQPAIDTMTQSLQAKPDEPVLHYTLGAAQLGAGKTDDAIASFKKAIDLAQAAKKPQPEILGASYNDLGNALVKTGKVEDAVASYNAAMKVDPTHSETFAMNETIVLTKAGKADEAAAAADKVIAANPQKADAYYLKAAALVQKASVDAKTGKIVLPPGCEEAYQKYLQLAPDGPHAAEVKEVLASAGETIKSSYKAGKKS
jgi:tetratricopeptide (TPR) repeat protein